WNNISWDEPLPYGEELPDDKSIESVAGGADMTGNVLLMHLDESSGTIFDTSGEGSNGTYNGDLYSQNGKINTAIGFDGLDDEIITGLNSSSINITTFSLWIKANETGRQTLISGYPAEGGKNPQRWDLELADNNSVRWFEHDTSTAIYASEIVLDRWTHVAVVHDNSTNLLKIYIDGVLDKTDSISRSLDTDTNIAIAGRPEGGTVGQFNGSIDEVAIWNRSLSADEILNVYKRGALRLNLSSRACSNADCSDGTFIVQGSNATLTELSDTGQYFQYRMLFETDSVNFTPELSVNSVTVNFTEFNVTLSTWDDTDNETRTALEQVYFYTNYTTTQGDPINGTGVYCSIEFNISGGAWEGLDNMTYNETSTLYQYNRTFSSKGTYPYKTTCDGSVIGFGVVNITDEANISNSVPVVTSVILNSSPLNNNFSSENLTLNYDASDVDGDNVTVSNVWYKYDLPYTPATINGSQNYLDVIFNLPFENYTQASDMYKDYSLYENTVTPMGSPDQITMRYGHGYHFDGSSDYLSLENTYVPSGQTPKFSFATWFSYEDQAEFRALLGIGQAGSSNTHLAVGLGGNSVLRASGNRIWITHWGASYDLNTGTDAHTGLNHLVYVCNGTHDLLYLDGQLKYTNPATFTLGTNPTARIGSSNNFVGQNYYWKGNMSEVLIWNNSLTEHQVSLLYSDQSQIITSDETSIGEVWSVDVTPNDGFEDGLTVSSNNLTIQNAAPSIDAVVLNSTFGTNKSNENLTAYPINVSDLDGDSVKNITNWYVNGTSIAVLNMPFEGVNGTDSDNAWDYSGYGNNGSENGGVIWNLTGGYDGKGAYEFDGLTSYLSLGTPSELQLSNQFTLSAWVNVGDFSTSKRIISKDDNSLRSYALQVNTDQKVHLYVWKSGSAYQVASNAVLDADKWYHVTGVNNGSHLVVYVNGSYDNSIADGGVFDTDNAAFEIGRKGDGSNYFNGTIDEPMVFNRTLSDSQIQAIYESRTDLIVSDETSVGGVWQACVTPNDGTDDGLTVSSNNFTVLPANSVPSVPVLLYPFDGNGSVVDLTPLLIWNNSVDVDNDSLTYNAVLANDSSFVNVLFNQSGIVEGSVNSSVTVSPELAVDQTYFWKVRSFDGEVYSSFSSVFNFTLVSYLAATFPQANVSFGSLGPNAQNSTEGGAFSPFVIENTGNIPVDVTIEGTPLFTSSSVPFPGSNYQFRVAQNETGSFNISAATTTYTNVTNSSLRIDIADFNWVDTNDSAIIHINISVPGDEPPGTKRSNLTVTLA
ncbi:hypothetical protein GF342_04490, partial [Candidatus Woesearchaeota archaeon]|nr:hypothetical protein [Candidatus Woesearchaeota archaeon]